MATETWDMIDKWLKKLGLVCHVYVADKKMDNFVFVGI